MPTQWFEAPTAGEAPDLAPGRLTTTHARALRNFLVHHPGRIVPRGGIGGPAARESGTLPPISATPSAASAIAGMMQRGDFISISYKASSAVPKVDHWRVPINRPTSTGDLAAAVIGADAVRGVLLDTGATNNATFAAPEDIQGERYCTVNADIYMGSVDGPPQNIYTTVQAQRTQIRKTDGPSTVSLTTGPHHVQDVFTHYGRVWAAAAQAPGAATGYDPSWLYYTIPGGTTAFTDVVTDWQDPETGELNAVQIGAWDGDFIVALGRAAGHLVVFKRRSVWVLYGTSPANFTLRQLLSTRGCVDARSVVTADEGVYFASQNGFERFDGTSFSLLSEPVSDTWLEFSNRGPSAATVNHSFIRVATMPNNYLHVALGTTPHTAAAVDGAERNWLFHTPTGAWIDLRAAITGVSMGAAGGFSHAVYAYGGVALWSQWQWMRADQLTYGPLETLGLMDRYSTNKFSVDLLWTTRLDELGAGRGDDARWITNTLANITPVYQQKWTTVDPPDGDTLATLSAADGYGATLVSGLVLPGYDPPGPTRAKPMLDAKHETNRGDVSLTVQSTLGSSDTKRIAALELYGIGVKWDVGRERRLA